MSQKILVSIYDVGHSSLALKVTWAVTCHSETSYSVDKSYFGAIGEIDVSEWHLTVF